MSTFVAPVAFKTDLRTDQARRQSSRWSPPTELGALGEAVGKREDAVVPVGEKRREGLPGIRHVPQQAVDQDHRTGVLRRGLARPVVRAGRAGAGVEEVGHDAGGEGVGHGKPPAGAEAPAA